MWGESKKNNILIIKRTSHTSDIILVTATHDSSLHLPHVRWAVYHSTWPMGTAVYSLQYFFHPSEVLGVAGKAARRASGLYQSGLCACSTPRSSASASLSSSSVIFLHMSVLVKWWWHIHPFNNAWYGAQSLSRQNCQWCGVCADASGIRNQDRRTRLLLRYIQ